MRNKIIRTFHILFGIVLILIGIAGLVLPILNGILFLLLGLILISIENEKVKITLSKYAHKSKITGDWYEKLNKWVKKVF